MKPARLISTSGSAFGSFVEPFEVQFPESGLVHLRGVNLDTKGSSASGKSTFIHAVNYPMGTCPVPLTALQSWYTKDPPRVTNTYDIDGKIVKVTKGKRFLLEIDGELVSGSAEQKEEKLDQLFGIDSEMRLALTYRAQRKPGLFLSKTDKKQKEFLTKLLNLDKWEEEQKKSIAKVKELEERCAVLRARHTDVLQRLVDLRRMGDGTEEEASLANVLREYEDHEALHRKYEKAVADMEHDAEVVYQAALDLYKPKLREVDERIEALRRVTVAAPPPTPELERLRGMATAISERLERLEGEDRMRMKDHSATLEALRSQWQSLSLQASGINKLMADRDRVVSDMKALSKNNCPTCLREWDEARARLEDLKVELEQINGEAEELRFVQEEADQLKVELDAMPRTLDPNPMIAQMRGALEKCKDDTKAEETRVNAEANAALKKLNDDLWEATSTRKSLEVEATNAAALARAQAAKGIAALKALVAQEVAIKSKLMMARDRLAVEVGAIRERRNQILASEMTASELLKELEPLQVELAKEKDFSHLTGREAFRGKVFDEALDAISEETNAILASIANTRNCTLEFKSENQTQDGKLRQEIVPVITINGHKAHSLDWGPSGGMLSAIELAVDLAVGKHIAERTGVCPGWLILDESFDGLGPREKDTCLEMLQLYAADRLVIIVDHTSETAGVFTKFISIESKDGVSTVTG